jgi:hypothetical protein
MPSRSPAYLDVRACRRRYEIAHQNRATYPLAALQALADRMVEASAKMDEAGGHAFAWILRDRARELFSVTRRREHVSRMETATEAPTPGEVTIARDGICPRCWSTDVSVKLAVCWSCENPRQESAS